MDIGSEIVLNLSSIYPDIPVGKPWIKYGKQRIYFNQKIDGVEHGFSIQILSESLKIQDYMEDYWNPLLGIESQSELEHVIDDLYYQAAYPPEIPVPSTTVREIRLHRRIEGVILEEDDEHYHVDPAFIEITFPLQREAVEKTVRTPRKHNGKSLHRLIIRRDYVDSVTGELERLEDEADAVYMRQLQKSMGSSITVGTNKSTDRRIDVEQKKEYSCSNCGKRFSTHPSDEQNQFCSSTCKQEYQSARS